MRTRYGFPDPKYGQNTEIEMMAKAIMGEFDLAAEGIESVSFGSNTFARDYTQSFLVKAVDADQNIHNWLNCESADFVGKTGSGALYDAVIFSHERSASQTGLTLFFINGIAEVKWTIPAGTYVDASFNIELGSLTLCNKAFDLSDITMTVTTPA